MKGGVPGETNRKQETRVREARKTRKKKVPSMSRLSQSVEMTSNDHLEKKERLDVGL